MKKQQVMALLLSSTLTIANVTPALAADISNVAVTSEVTQDAPADDVTVVEENTETCALFCTVGYEDYDYVFTAMDFRAMNHI